MANTDRGFNGGPKSLHLLSFDIEDWFHAAKLESKVKRRDWDAFESRVESNTHEILRILEDSETKATFFFLGWVAETHPNLVRLVSQQGHEIGSHGFSHQLLPSLTAEEFREDIQRSKGLLEDLSGLEVRGYRAPGFSITSWAVELIQEVGFHYDSSLFPTNLNSRYGTVGYRPISPGLVVGHLENNLIEVPVGTVSFRSFVLPWGGGGYFRFYPYRFFKWGIKRTLRLKGPFTFYLHPWDLDPGQPRLDGLPLRNRFLHYGFAGRAGGKLGRLVTDFRFVPIWDGLMEIGAVDEAEASH